LSADRTVTLRSFLAAGTLKRRLFVPDLLGNRGGRAVLRKAAAVSILAAIFTQLSGALSQILSRGQ
jgi:hypothetical protein